MKEFHGRTCLITGGASGIGRRTAELFHSYGSNVFLIDRDGEATGKTMKHLDPTGSCVAGEAADVTDSDACAKAVEACVSRFGGIDYVVHSAGIFGQADLAEARLDEWRRVVDINLMGTANVLQPALPHLGAGSAIVTISSMAASRSGAGVSAYAASKSAVESMTRSLAKELAPQTRVNCVAPGLIETPLGNTAVTAAGSNSVSTIPLGRRGTPAEIAATIAFLCSEAASYITGETLHVNGGLLMK